MVLEKQVGVSIGNINKKPAHFLHNERRTTGPTGPDQRMVLEPLLGVPLMAWKIPTESDRGLLGLSSTGLILKKTQKTKNVIY